MTAGSVRGAVRRRRTARGLVAGSLVCCLLIAVLAVLTRPVEASTTRDTATPTLPLRARVGDDHVHRVGLQARSVSRNRSVPRAPHATGAPAMRPGPTTGWTRVAGSSRLDVGRQQPTEIGSRAPPR